jgi:hypothetical protein
MNKKRSMIVNDILIDADEPNETTLFPDNVNLAEYYFDIEIDSEIDREELCEAVESLEINNQFIDEELICPDKRTDRFDIYATRVSPEDLEDCN